MWQNTCLESTRPRVQTFSITKKEEKYKDMSYQKLCMYGRKIRLPMWHFHPRRTVKNTLQPSRRELSSPSGRGYFCTKALLDTSAHIFLSKASHMITAILQRSGNTFPYLGWPPILNSWSRIRNPNIFHTTEYPENTFDFQMANFSSFFYFVLICSLATNL